MSDSIATRMEHLREGKVTKSQRILLNYIESTDFKHIIYLSITQLAEETNVAEATVLRFCRSLGFSGYQEFKLNLAQDMINGDFQKESEGFEYITEIVNDFEEALKVSHKSLQQTAVSRSIEILSEARTVSCYGVGNSYLSAMEMNNRLVKMGIISSCAQDPHIGNILVSSRTEVDALVLFSVSGGTKDVIEVAEFARSSGMKIIVITCHEKSPLARYADVVLSTATMESPTRPGAMSSRIMQLYTVEVVCTGLYHSDTHRFDKFMSKSNLATVGKLV